MTEDEKKRKSIIDILFKRLDESLEKKAKEDCGCNGSCKSKKEKR